MRFHRDRQTVFRAIFASLIQKKAGKNNANCSTKRTNNDSTHVPYVVILCSILIISLLSSFGSGN